MAVLGNRGTGILDMLIEGFRRSGQKMEQPNMSQVAPTPLQRAMNQPVSRLTSTGDVGTIYPDGRVAQQTSVPLLQNLARGRVLNPINPMQDMGQPMIVSEALRKEAVAEALNRPEYGQLVEAKQAEQQPQATPDVMGMQKLAEDAAKVKKAIDENPQLEEDPTFMDQVKGYFGNRENMIRLAMAFNTMRLTPDTGLATALGSELKDIRALRTTNRTAMAVAARLRQMGPEYVKYAQMVESNPAIASDVLKQVMKQQLKPKGSVVTAEEIRKLYPGTEIDDGLYNLKTDGTVTKVGGGGIDITLPTESGEKKLFEQVGKGSGDMIIKQAEQLPELQNQVANLQILDQLSEALATGATNIPDFLKGVVPEGMNSSIDAYRAMVFTVAQGLRQAGTGPMTDKDFDILVSRAGSISADVNARRIAQAALRRAANNALRRARIAEQFRLNPTEEGQQKYRVEIETLNQELEEGILTPTERTLLQKMGPQQQAPQYDTSGMNQATSTYFNSLSAPAQAYFMSQSPQKQQELVQSGQTR